MARLELRGVGKVYPGGIRALDDINLSVQDGEFLVVLGASGSGKSSLLRLVAGLEDATEGTIWLGDRNSSGLSPADRDIAMVFQTPALFPHLTVRENMAFGLRARRVARTEVRDRVSRAAGLLGLDGLLDRPPRALSGGQRQRVALGRALVRRPGIVLLDEPLSNLDAPLRTATRAELADFHHVAATTCMMVTHDQAEALALGDRVAVIDAGKILQVGTPREVYDRPASRSVAKFVGSPPMNLVRCQVLSAGEDVRVGLIGLAAGVAELGPLQPAAIAVRGRGVVDLGIRAEAIRLGGEPSARQLRIPGRIKTLEFEGSDILALLDAAPGQFLRVRMPVASRPAMGDALELIIDLDLAVWFDANTGALLG